MKRQLKALRASQPANAILSSSLRLLVGRSERGVDFLSKHLPRSGLVECQLPNGRTLRLWSLGDDAVASPLYWKGWRGFEPETVSVFFALAARSSNIVDIGAHIGLFSLLAALANPAAKVLALEPLPLAYERLLTNIHLNTIDNIVPLRMAAGSIIGEASFFHISENETPGIPSSSSLNRRFMTSQWDTISCTVPVTTVDYLTDSHALPTVDLVKMDTETTEPDVLEGMRLTLERFRPVIFCEVLAGWGVERRLDDLLRPFDYRYYRLDAAGPVNDETLQGGHNYAFVPEGYREIESIFEQHGLQPR